MVCSAARRSADAFAVRLVQILNQQYGKTVVMVTHDPKAEYATRQLNVDKG
jgi:putative ABC transport system ATP-binding protein